MPTFPPFQAPQGGVGVMGDSFDCVSGLSSLGDIGATRQKASKPLPEGLLEQTRPHVWEVMRKR